MLTSVRPYASKNHGRITLPGAEGGYGHAVDGLEGFARTFLLAGFRLAGENDDPLNLAQWYAEGIAEGVDPDSPNRWVRCEEHSQAKVEAASIALILDMTRDKIWNHLDDTVKSRVIDYLSPVVGDTTYPRNNWLWFRIVVETFLRSVGGPWSQTDIEEDLALHDSFVRQDGWLSDGAMRAYDHYVGWALHLYPTLWQRMEGAHELADDTRRNNDFNRLSQYLVDAAHLVGADGGPLIEGRSLIYRFAAAAPFWAGAVAGVSTVEPGLLRRCASGIISYFMSHGVPDERGLLTMGWFDEDRSMAQMYSGPSSPYWAAKGMLGLALPADHPVWSAIEEPLPVENGDFVRAITSPGWVASGTKSDGIVRVINHGADHAFEGDAVGDSPLYTQFGYSTLTAPSMDDAAYRTPLAQTVALVDDLGRLTHRAGMTLLGTGIADGIGYGASTGDLHWIDFPQNQTNHGSGYEGTATTAGHLTAVSLVHGPWELRAALISNPHPAATAIRFIGWPVQVADGEIAQDAFPEAVLIPAEPQAVENLGESRGTSILGGSAAAPTMQFAITPDAWTCCFSYLGNEPIAPATTGTVRVTDNTFFVEWPDGRTTETAVDAVLNVDRNPRILSHAGISKEKK
jgi:hypothetical protein